MNQMLEQFGKDYKATTMKKLQWAVTNSLETNGKINKKFQQKKKKKQLLQTKRNQMGIIELKNAISEIKNFGECAQYWE